MKIIRRFSVVVVDFTFVNKYLFFTTYNKSENIFKKMNFRSVSSAKKKNSNHVILLWGKFSC